MANVAKSDMFRRPVAQVMLNNPLPTEGKYQQPAIVFNGCTFTGYAVVLSGPSTSIIYYKEKRGSKCYRST